MEGRFVYGDDVYVDDHYMDEDWDYIDGRPGYMISNKSRVWSEKTQRFIKVKPMDDHGHLGVCLHVNGKSYYDYIHRLVAKAFIPNLKHLPIVRHLDDQPDNNEYDNLAWGTQKDNHKDSVKNGTVYYLTNEDRYKGYRDRMRPLIATNISTGEEIYFESQTEAARRLNIPQANIWKVIRKERRTAGGYTFKEVENESDY